MPNRGTGLELQLQTQRIFQSLSSAIPLAHGRERPVSKGDSTHTNQKPLKYPHTQLVTKAGGSPGLARFLLPDLFTALGAGAGGLLVSGGDRNQKGLMGDRHFLPSTRT